MFINFLIYTSNKNQNFSCRRIASQCITSPIKIEDTSLLFCDNNNCVEFFPRSFGSNPKSFMLGGLFCMRYQKPNLIWIGL